jgi:hypothetical protein
MTDVSKRINLSVPDAVYDDLEFWAKTQGRPLANLSAFLLESALNQAKAEGIFPERKEPPNSGGKAQQGRRE